jgi:hypothetical protein
MFDAKAVNESLAGIGIDRSKMPVRHGALLSL